LVTTAVPALPVNPDI